MAQRTPAVFQSFNYAFEGVIHALRTQRNMRIHFAVAAGVLVLAFIYDVTRLELIALMIAIAFVLIAEMVNTAVEATIDLSTPSFDPLAKIAKDLAAGAVLIASVNAIAVGYLVLADRLKRPSARLVNELGDAPVNLTVIALVLTLIIVIAVLVLGVAIGPLLAMRNPAEADKLTPGADPASRSGKEPDASENTTESPTPTDQPPAPSATRSSVES